MNHEGDGSPGDGVEPTAEPTADLDPRESARLRRRDHDAEAERRALMRPGMGKVFKQIQDAQAKAAREPVARRSRRSR